MRLVAVVLIGVFLTFALTAVGEETAMTLRDTGTHLPYFEAVVLFPFVALVVGSFVGLLARNKSLLGAILVFGPFVVCALPKIGLGHREFSWWLILITLVSMYLWLGVGAAVYVSRIMNRSVSRSS